MSMRLNDIIDPRHAGQVERYHTYPHLEEQNIAQHSWHVTRIIWSIWPELPIHVLSHAMFHDIGEVGPGDITWRAKKEDRSLKQCADKLERKTRENMSIPWWLPPYEELTAFEEAIFKLVECIEMFEYACYEYNLGNSYAKLIMDKQKEEMDKRSLEIPKMEGIPKDVNVTTIMFRASNYILRRKSQEIRIHGDNIEGTGNEQTDNT